MALTKIKSSNILDGTIANVDLGSGVGAGGSVKNLIINGDFTNVIDQRGSSGASATTGYCVDRWSRIYSISVQKNTGYTRFTDTSSNNSSRFHQKIEYGKNAFNGKKVTLSIKVKRVSGSAQLSLRMMIGSGVYTSNVSFTPTANYDTYSATFDFTSSNITIENPEVMIYMGGGNVLDIQYVQLELGSTASDFEYRSYGEELALCQRYYQVHPAIDREIYDYGQGRIHYNLPVTMRTLSYTVAMLHGTHTVNRNNNTLITFNTGSGNFRFSLDAEL